MEGARLGPYQLLAELGSGGMGKVYLAEVAGHAPGLDDGAKVALKVIHAHLLETPGFFKRFLREAEIGKSVEQDNVVRCFDCDALLVDGHQQHYLVMEYVEGQTLRDLLRELDRVPEELCRHIGREIAKGLVAIHDAGVIHRDLKPENVLITEDHVVKVMDLGVARLQDEAIRLSQTGAFVGSLEYASPEQFRGGGKDLDARSDLHALGVMLYELSTGQHPYRTGDVSSTLKNVIDGQARRAGEVNPQLSPFFEEMVHTLAAKEPDERFASASVLLTALDEGEKSEWWRERAKALRIQTKRPLRRIRIPRETALYGRDDDLAKLQALFDQAKDGDGQVLLVEGEAGIGKTRLVDEFVGRLRQAGEDVNFLFGSYPPGGAATAAGAFSEAYREQFGAEGLEESLEDYLTPTPILIPAFAAILKGETTPQDAASLTKDSLQTVFVHATRGLAEERTTIVLIDDLHFAPEDGRALFSSLAMAVPGHRVLLVGTMRPGVPEDWTANVTRLDHAEQRSLSRLGPKDLTNLLKDSFRSERLALELAGQIAIKCDGNPFFAFEIIRGLREGQFITQNPDGTWVTTKVIQDIQVPSTVLDLVNARVADLTEDERDLLDVASCCGFEFDPTLVGDILGLPRVAALKRLGQVERRHRLVRSSGRDYRFDHHQVQEALYGSLNERLREEYHAAIGEVLEERTGATDGGLAALDGSLCVDMCEHFLRGDRGERALHYLDSALEHLESGYLNDQAVGLMDRVLLVPGLISGTGRAELLLRVAERYRILGRREEQGASIAEAVRLADESGDLRLQSRAHRSLGTYFGTVSKHEAWRREMEHALALARDSGGTDEEAAATINLGNYHNRREENEEACEHYERGLDLARRCGNLTWEARATGNLGTALHDLSRYAEAEVQHARTLALCAEIGDRELEGLARTSLGNTLYEAGRLDEAESEYKRSLAISREIGARLGECTAAGNLGGALLATGRIEAGTEYLRQATSIAREIGALRNEAASTMQLGNAFFHLGRHNDAREHYERALNLYQLDRNRTGEASARLNLGNILLATGDVDEARGHYEQSLAVARESRDAQLVAIASGNLGTALEHLNLYEAARRHHEQCLTTIRRAGNRRLEAMAIANLAFMLNALGRHSDALEQCERAIATARGGKDRSAEATALLAMSSAVAEAGDCARGVDFARESVSLYRELGEAPGAADALRQLGELRTRVVEDGGGLEELQEATALFRELRRGRELCETLALRAGLMDGDVAEAEAALQEWGVRGDGPGVRYYLWKATGKHEHLTEAKRLLDYRVEHAPEEYRESMLKNVRLNREIMEEWAEHGGRR